ncbi:hypothetical protein ACQP1K_22555 [Sphaerimonospora sp. CA-214678]|uniref:hypothetical protein n=1 Tax=Sphaerimonospora sp. CA-214678 TaxID=3240029 RepID=UPI003D932B7D
MNTRIETDGFGSFQDFAPGMPPFPVLVGSGAGGESNLLDAVNFGGDGGHPRPGRRGGRGTRRRAWPVPRARRRHARHATRFAPETLMGWWNDMIEALEGLGYQHG